MLRAGLVKITSKQATPEGMRIVGTVTDNGRPVQVNAKIDHDDRIVDATCTCAHFRQHKLYKGPCVHILALRRTFNRDRAASGGVSNIVKGLWGGSKNA
jgi:predicted nucleic acid-binding Zn finger protein